MRTEKLTAWCATMGLLLTAWGCGDNSKGYKAVPKGVEVKETAHHHEHEHGPHDGHLIELGDEEYHAEVVYDGEAKAIRVYVLGADPHQANPIDQKEVALNLMIDGKATQFQAVASPEEGETDGKSSRFELAITDEIGAHIHDIEELAGRVTVNIGGKQYVGELSHDHDHEDGHDHGEADHKHEDHDKDDKDK